ncbi:MAG: undecaprenyl/decaprenyl-phosphate alpha-N-acetylglucosaminyl 1-phosphate transferase [Planctomycetes bacterium]|nr:undecaprenyl/decaprenyl-phosphate alpha-N-acetylglucosaminyl 1-phosphate transferase [Planctomycetota bacterium]
MSPAAAAAGAALLLSAALIPLLRRWAERRRLLDEAGGDPLKIHAAPVPFVGGIGVAAGLLAGVLAGWAPGGSGGAEAVGLLGLLAAAGAAGILGFRDDVADVPPAARLLVEVLLGSAAAALAAGTGLWPSSLPGPFAAAGIAGVILLGTLFAAGGVNALNMFDGMDGLAGSAVLLTAAGVFAAAAEIGPPGVAPLAAALGGAAAGFLLHNLPPASVFLGDNGAYLCGFLAGTLALTVGLAEGSARGLAGAVLLVGLPVLDAALAIARRVARGASPFAGDRSHLYDFLARRGLGRTAVALACAGLQAACVAAGLALLGCL